MKKIWEEAFHRDFDSVLRSNMTKELLKVFIDGMLNSQELALRKKWLEEEIEYIRTLNNSIQKDTIENFGKKEVLLDVLIHLQAELNRLNETT